MPTIYFIGIMIVGVLGQGQYVYRKIVPMDFIYRTPSFFRVSCRGGTKVREKVYAKKPDVIDIPASQSNAFVEHELSA